MRTSPYTGLFQGRHGLILPPFVLLKPLLHAAHFIIPNTIHRADVKLRLSKNAPAIQSKVDGRAFGSMPLQILEALDDCPEGPSVGGSLHHQRFASFQQTVKIRLGRNTRKMNQRPPLVLDHGQSIVRKMRLRHDRESWGEYVKVPLEVAISADYLAPPYLKYA